ncbi:MAG: hypothetical protein N3F03_07690 [Ignavibacteria bacterium]|nr:hypothetical protein [Ignavibacteria bacterium]
MQRFFAVIIFLFIINSLYGQILISPYIVYTDDKNRIGNFIVQNESDNFYEISISFVFGYPVSDSTGQVVMKYLENDSAQVYSITNYIRAFPKKFLLEPKKRQVVRLTIKAPDSLPSGTYWTRIVTSAVPFEEQQDTVSKGITAKIKFVLNQVTTCLYRVQPAESGLELRSSGIKLDSNKVVLDVNVERIGNSPFIGSLNIKITDEKGLVVKEMSEYIPVYFQLQKRFYFDKSEFSAGKNYFIHISATNNEKEDIPESLLKILKVPDEKISFKINLE